MKRRWSGGFLLRLNSRPEKAIVKVDVEFKKDFFTRNAFDQYFEAHLGRWVANTNGTHRITSNRNFMMFALPAKFRKHTGIPSTPF